MGVGPRKSSVLFPENLDWRSQFRDRCSKSIWHILEPSKHLNESFRWPATCVEIVPTLGFPWLDSPQFHHSSSTIARQFKCRLNLNATKQLSTSKFTKGNLKGRDRRGSCQSLHCSEPQLPALGPKRFVFHDNSTVAYNLQVDRSRFDATSDRSDFHMCYESKVEAKWEASGEQEGRSRMCRRSCFLMFPNECIRAAFVGKSPSGSPSCTASDFGALRQIHTA